MKPPTYRKTNDLKPGTSLVSHSGRAVYVLLRHMPKGVVWLNLDTAAEEPMEEGRVDESTWKVVEP